jgi:hypothetical protein
VYLTDEEGGDNEEEIEEVRAALVELEDEDYLYARVSCTYCSLERCMRVLVSEYGER